MPTHKTYRKHNCNRAHRTWRTAAKCIWPRAHWIHGEGSWVLLAWCRALTVTLHSDLASAETQKAFIDKTGCGGKCGGRHEIVHLADTTRHP